MLTEEGFSKKVEGHKKRTLVFFHYNRHYTCKRISLEFYNSDILWIRVEFIIVSLIKVITSTKMNRER